MAAKKAAAKKTTKSTKAKKSEGPKKMGRYAVVKKTEAFVIVKKPSGRYGVKSLVSRKWVGGEEKVKILAQEGLVKAQTKKSEAASEEAPAES